MPRAVLWAILTNMRIYIETLGCRLNYAEMASLGRQLTAAGHQLASSADEADLCVLNSCAVTGQAARQSRQMARQMARTNPAARLIVTGCYATLDRPAVALLPNVTQVVSNSGKDELLSVIQAAAGDDIPSGQPEGTANAVVASSDLRRTRAFVKVQDGCRNHCTFCIVTVARGDEHSRPISDIVAEVRELCSEGYREAVLTGVHLGGYGSDLGAGLSDVVRALLQDTDIARLRLSSLEPFDLQPSFFDLWSHAGGRLMPHLHLPAQSGSDAMLKRMARRNRVLDFERLVAAARSRIPGLTITTDLIAGFPGETEADFEQTIAFAQRIKFAHMHVFPYSAREGTAAARFTGQVPEIERKRRVRILTELDRENGVSVRASFAGQARPVLWEHEQASPTPGPGRTWTGLTDNYLRVCAVAPADRDLHNQITEVHLTGLIGDDLVGEV